MAIRTMVAAHRIHWSYKRRPVSIVIELVLRDVAVSVPRREVAVQVCLAPAP